MKTTSSIIIIIIVVSVSVFTWFVSNWQYDTMMSSMMTFYYSPAALSLFAIIWTAGMAAMMFPAIIPMILFYNRLIDSSKGSNGNFHSHNSSQCYIIDRIILKVIGITTIKIIIVSQVR